MKTLIALLLCSFPVFALAQTGTDSDVPGTKPCEQWCTPFFKALPPQEYVYDLMLAADVSTTLDIKNHPNLQEENPILGPHPSQEKIILVGGLAAGVLHSLITYELVDGKVPKPIINVWEYSSIAIEAGFAAHNYKIGLRFKF